ncbi:flagellar export protein FliJ [Halobacteroides halobius DSM 5150]|uniref:Flagellar FliJ protein n=1 Tax=Halobacteroides halobius (strain ATCC 35273 / DSM 5150 / MD-1) TaxID=748449 RepID=L0K8D3_HALHC|nr:flagellar export protein FliJ [Halobacteroides halobius]AGB40629.1 flagellar export protein FliJ [Halobacteroides halobius DSM 5150]
MKEFEFRLQSLLDLREQEEQLLQKKLFEIKQKYNQVKEEIKRLADNKKEWQEKIEVKTQQGVRAQNLLRYRNYIEYLESEIEELELQLDHWSQKLDECQQKLLDKVKERKTVSKLKEKEYEKHWQELLQKRQKINDEIANNNFNHQSSF